MRLAFRCSTIVELMYSAFLTNFPLGREANFGRTPSLPVPPRSQSHLRQSLFPPRPKLPSFNRSKSSYTLPANWQRIALDQLYPTHLNSDSGAPLSLVPAIKVEKYCDEALRYPVKAALSIPLLRHPDVDVKVVGTWESGHNPSLLPVKAEFPPPTRKRSGSSIGDPLPRKRQKVFNAPRAKLSTTLLFMNTVPQRTEYSDIEDCG
ncbi:hypothetical protein F5146DRAFT_1031194 [Armillaria mellea]|nr:hypothetical protein F5146DRAFT_1031194 [Armillaria mellea]